MSGDIVDEIDALVDEQLAGGPVDDYRVNRYDRCPHCGRDWHGMPLTPKIVMMHALGEFDEDYRAADDYGPVLCPGSDFIGPVPLSGDGWPLKPDLSGWGTATPNFRVLVGDGAPAWITEAIDGMARYALDAFADLIGGMAGFGDAINQLQRAIQDGFDDDPPLIYPYRIWLTGDPPPENRRLPMPLEYARPLIGGPR